MAWSIIKSMPKGKIYEIIRWLVFGFHSFNNLREILSSTSQMNLFSFLLAWFRVIDKLMTRQFIHQWVSLNIMEHISCWTQSKRSSNIGLLVCPLVWLRQMKPHIRVYQHAYHVVCSKALFDKEFLTSWVIRTCGWCDHIGMKDSATSVLGRYGMNYFICFVFRDKCIQV